MKENKLVYGAILAAFMLNTVTLNNGYCTSGKSLSRQQYVIETAQRVGPEEMIKAFYFKGGGLDTHDYNNPEEVYITQQFIMSLYPDRPDLFKKAVCTLGKCIERDERYTKKQADKVVKFMLNFKADAE